MAPVVVLGSLGGHGEASVPPATSFVVTSPKLPSVNPVESLVIHPDGPTYDQLGDRPCKIIRVSVREGE
jgi:hypothetical protein